MQCIRRLHFEYEFVLSIVTWNVMYCTRRLLSFQWDESKPQKRQSHRRENIEKTIDWMETKWNRRGDGEKNEEKKSHRTSHIANHTCCCWFLLRYNDDDLVKLTVNVVVSINRDKNVLCSLHIMNANLDARRLNRSVWYRTQKFGKIFPLFIDTTNRFETW